MNQIFQNKLYYIFLLILIGFITIDNLKAQQQETEQRTDKPNVILITISSLRADHVSCLGYTRETTPNFDEFAGNNILFTNVFATSSWQMPAVGSIYTSLYPPEHGATHIDNKLKSDVVTLAGIMSENGFYTVSFGCNPRLSSENGFDKGFDLFDDYSVEMILSAMSFGLEESFDVNKKRTNDLINDTAINWLQKNKSYPFFLNIHYYDNHWDYLPPELYYTLYDAEYDGDITGREISKEPLYSNRPSSKDVEHIIALYDGEIRQTDGDLGELIDFLSQQGRFDDSIILIMADHGEEIYEHDHTNHHGIYDEMIHVPLAISIPGFTGPKVSSSLISGVDIMPTILDYLNISIPNKLRGQSFKDVVNGNAEKIRDFVFVEYSGKAVGVPDCSAVRFKKYKFVFQEDKIFAYDLVNDPGEKKRIYEENFTDEMKDLFDSIKNILVTGIQLPEQNEDNDKGTT